LRLKSSFRYALYAAFAALVLTGAGWFVADWQKDPSGDEIWQQIAANMLMVHGGVAMLTLLMLGALIPLHILRAWRAAKNRISGSIMATLNVALILTAFGLYYLGSENLRPWISWTHIGAGVCLAVWLPMHVWLGRREMR
jgi:cytochrome c biogenesis protein CcdA